MWKLKPDASSYKSVMSVCEKAGKWQQTLNFFEKMEKEELLLM